MPKSQTNECIKGGSKKWMNKSMDEWMNEWILCVPVFIIFGRPELFHHQAELVSLWLEGLGHKDKEFEHTRDVPVVTQTRSGHGYQILQYLPRFFLKIKTLHSFSLRRNLVISWGEMISYREWNNHRAQLSNVPLHNMS